MEDAFSCHGQGVGWKSNPVVVDEDDMFKDKMIVHWARLVDRPACVDMLEIYVNDELRVREKNPTFYIFNQKSAL